MLGVIVEEPVVEESAGSATTTGSLWVAKDARVVGTLNSSDIAFNNLNNERIYTITEGDREGLIGNELVFKNASNTPFFILTQNKVAIGTTTPTNILTIGQGMGNAIADGWAVYSSEQYKTDITYLEEQDYEDILEEIEELNTATYNWKDLENQSNKKNFGVIAEEAPERVLSEDGKSVSLYDYTTFALAGVKAVKTELDKLKEALGVIKNEDGSLSTIDSSLPSADQNNIVIRGEGGQEYQLALDNDGYVILDKIKVKDLELVSGGQLTIASGDNEIMGSGEIIKDQRYAQIDNEKITDDSKIFISFTSNLDGNNWWICEKEVGEYFRLCISSPAQTLTTFDYWIIESNQIISEVTEETATTTPLIIINITEETSTSTQSIIIEDSISTSTPEVIVEETVATTIPEVIIEEPVVESSSTSTPAIIVE